MKTAYTLILLASAAFAQDNLWQDANTTVGTTTDTDIDDPAFFSA